MIVERGCSSMANIFDYLDWRGDISFQEDPFNEVDNLVLSWMAYVHLDGILPSGVCNVSVTIGEAAERFFQIYDLEEKLKEYSLTRTSALLFHKLKDCPRFSDMRILNYVNHISVELQQQFSAMTIEIDKDLLYIAYRGTDDTIVGWREDFNMSFLPSVPSQIEAVEYLNTSVRDRAERLILGGHSKGGNLALYAAMHCESTIKDKIIRVFNNDGPGFLSDVLQSKEYQEILPRVTTIVPESSIIGMLLGHEEEYEIVRSSQRGIMQHDAGTWEVERNGFVYLDSLSNSSKFLNKSFKEWVYHLDEEHRKMFVDGLFQMLEAAGAKTTGELYTLGFKNVSGALKVFNGMDMEMKQNLLLIARRLFDIMNHNLKAERRKAISSIIEIKENREVKESKEYIQEK